MADVELTEKNMNIKFPALGRQILAKSSCDSEFALITSIELRKDDCPEIHHYHIEHIEHRRRMGQRYRCPMYEMEGGVKLICFMLCDMSVKDNQEMYEHMISEFVTEQL